LARRVFLHVGSPKTGTTYLQDVFWSQRALAEDEGLLLPLDTFHDHFLASADVREIAHQARFPPRAIGIWKRVVDDGSRWHGDVLVSHELLAAASAEQAAHAVQAWIDAEVHVVVTARDLQRQIPAEWQEHVKHRSSTTFSEFVREVRDGGPASRWFWKVQDSASICRRWGGAVPPQNIHVVTVPPQGTARDVLWRRFATVLGLDPDRFDAATSSANSSLSAERAELLRRVNQRLNHRLPMPGAYVETVKEVFAKRVLSGSPGSPVALSDGDRMYAVERSLELVADLHQQGVDIVGDATELIGSGTTEPRAGASLRPESLPDAALLDAGVEALCALLEEYNTQRRQLARNNRAGRQLQEQHRQVETPEAVAGLKARYGSLVKALRNP